MLRGHWGGGPRAALLRTATRARSGGHLLVSALGLTNLLPPGRQLLALRQGQVRVRLWSGGVRRQGRSRNSAQGKGGRRLEQRRARVVVARRGEGAVPEVVPLPGVAATAGQQPFPRVVPSQDRTRSRWRHAASRAPRAATLAVRGGPSACSLICFLPRCAGARFCGLYGSLPLHFPTLFLPQHHPLRRHPPPTPRYPPWPPASPLEEPPLACPLSRRGLVVPLVAAANPALAAEAANATPGSQAAGSGESWAEVARRVLPRVSYAMPHARAPLM